MSLKEVVAAVFVLLFSIKTFGWLLGSKRVLKNVKKLYSGVYSKVIYFLIFLTISLILLRDIGIINYVLAVLAIGALYDYFFAVFSDESVLLVNAAVKNKKKMWF